MAQKRGNPIDWFWAKVDKSPGQGPKGKCHEYKGYRNARSYGFYHKGIGGNHLAHRIAFALANPSVDIAGVDPKTAKKWKVRHKICNNPPCCNPRHLRRGTQRQNIDDMLRDGTQRKGESSPRSKLKEAQVVKILRLLSKGHDQVSIARRFGVARSAIWYIAKGKTWKHLPRIV